MLKWREPLKSLKKFFSRLDKIAQEKGVDTACIEIWFADEARIGQKNKITRRWPRQTFRTFHINLRLNGQRHST